MTGNIIWTNHLEERVRQRGISKNEAFETIRHPEQSIHQGGGKWKFFKTFSRHQVVIVAQYENNQWIILTTWAKPLGYQQRSGYSTQEPFISKVVRTLLVKFVNMIGSLFSKR